MGIICVSVLVLGVFVGIAADGGEHHFAVVLLEQGKRIEIIVVISVVKGDHHRFIWQFFSVFYVIDQIRDDNGGVPVFLQVFQVLLKQIGRYDVLSLPFFFFEKPVIHDDGQFDCILRFGLRIRLDGGDNAERKTSACGDGYNRRHHARECFSYPYSFVHAVVASIFHSPGDASFHI